MYAPQIDIKNVTFKFLLDSLNPLGYSNAMINTEQHKENSVDEKLKEQIREAARVAEATCMDDSFNAMSWLDLTLEDNPEYFDDFFNTTWAELSEDQRQERTVAIRRVL